MERKVLGYWARDFIDRDGKFVHEFQTTFWASLWELYLFAVFKDLGCHISLDHPSPDFDVASPCGPFVAEAAVALQAQGFVSERHREPGQPVPKVDIPALLEYA